ncbi:hypothetical protein BGZ63DRAFT_414055 [Mariannaea sp. PMI_226]|nr:hypothetical protein BGZ63DRAFT_414055 [Mariannaea sp. PMI_226]
MGSFQPAAFDVKKVAIIGAGPAGLAAAKYLIAQDAFKDIVVFEQQDQVGGIWNYTGLASASCPAPQESPFCPPDQPIRLRADVAPTFTSPMYENLHANIPLDVMRFSCQKFPEDARLFPERTMIQDYLVKYAQEVRGLVRFCQRINLVSLTPRDGVDKWEVESESTVTGSITKETFDAVVVANGHYSTPFIPNIKNLKEFNNTYPGICTHSKQYRTPHPFASKKVVVVGNGPSGLDIALQINQECRKPALMSVRHPTPAERLAHTGCEEVAEIDEFLIEGRGVRFKDGRVETNIDAIVFCTGFLYSLPFLADDLKKKFITTGRGVSGLYQHLFSIQHPTLAFPALNMKAAPWPLSESQAAAFSAVWSNNIKLPPKAEMEMWNRKLLQEEGDAMHVFKPLDDGHYINEFHDWVMSTKQPAKEPPRWDDELMWQRAIFLAAKAKFEQMGCTALTLEELGFRYRLGWAEEEKI